MSGIIDQLRQDHVNFSRLLDLLYSQLDLIHEGQTADFELMQDMMGYMTHYPDRFHHPLEDLVFAKLREHSAVADSALQILEKEHKGLADKGEQFLNSLKSVVDGALTRRDTLEAQGRDYVAFLRFHMDREEGEVFPLAEKLLSQADWTHIGSEMALQEDPLFGSVVAEDYRALYRYISQ